MISAALSTKLPCVCCAYTPVTLVLISVVWIQSEDAPVYYPVHIVAGWALHMGDVIFIKYDYARVSQGPI